MYIYILAILAVSFISLCFFKKRFWENRYLVLVLIGGVALLATLTTNYATRSGLGTRLETISQYDIRVFSLNTTYSDTNNVTNGELTGFEDHLVGADSTAASKYSRHMFYYNSDGKLCVGFASEDDLHAKTWKNIYIAPSNSENIAYYAKLRKYYNKRSDKWVTDFSLPYIESYHCLYLPPSEYAAIPDSLIRELPF